MIKVLTSWEDLGKSIESLQRDQCYHADPLKNWDLSQIGEILDPMPRSSRILDAGCSESQCSVLWYLKKKGFYELAGMDLHISIDDRMQQLLPMWKERKLKPPFRLSKGNVTQTNFAKESFDAIVCLSVIEHGVELKAFMKEMNRLLKPGGMLYVSTDYWPDKVLSEDKTPWGLKWTVFSREEIFDIIKTAREAGMAIRDCEIPAAGNPIVKWSGREYTFLSMVFGKI
jgi:2-polyprenyl-3-methyl-5-hydroxy-6-metoxy-1,4-benzoquinol methylase